MGILDNFEKGLERVVNGAFAKTFKSGLQPLEITAALRRELDTKAAVVSRDRILVPNRFTVRLAPGDYERMTNLGPALIDEFTQLVQQHAAAQHYSFAGGISIALERDTAPQRGPRAHRLRQREGRGRLDPGARHRRQALPDHQVAHHHRPRLRRRHHRRRHRHLPQARRDPLGRQARPGQRPRLDQRLEAQRPAAASRRRCRPIRSSRSVAPASCSACSPRPPTSTSSPTCETERAADERTDPPPAAARLPACCSGSSCSRRLRAALRPLRPARAAAARPAAGVSAALGHGRLRDRRAGPAPTTESAAHRAPPHAGTSTATRLVITSGPREGLEIDLPSEQLTIGRSSESGLVIRDDYTSTHHARLMLWNDQWVIQDLDSTNGTFLDGSRVTLPTPVPLGHAGHDRHDELRAPAVTGGHDPHAHERGRLPRRQDPVEQPGLRLRGRAPLRRRRRHGRPRRRRRRLGDRRQARRRGRRATTPRPKTPSSPCSRR